MREAAPRLTYAFICRRAVPLAGRRHGAMVAYYIRDMRGHAVAMSSCARVRELPSTRPHHLISHSGPLVFLLLPLSD